MAASRDDISDWFDAGRTQAASYMLIVTDTFDWEDYPVYAKSVDEAHAQYARYNGPNMQRVQEVYDLALDKAAQMAERRAFHLP